jgi:hypothetical protein
MPSTYTEDEFKAICRATEGLLATGWLGGLVLRVSRTLTSRQA